MWMWHFLCFLWSGYDAALYTAATSYYQQQQQQQQAKTTTNWGFKKQATFGQKMQKQKPPPKQPQLHYCDVCKISCAGPQVTPPTPSYYV